MKNIEIELSGPLTATKYQELINFFENQPSDRVTIKPEKHRVLIDYSTFLGDGLKNRHTDIRLRITNGQPEIIVKLGHWGSTGDRKELSALTKGNDFDTLVQIFATLGYKKGMLCERTTKVYQYHDIEFALVKMPGDNYLYEAEIMADASADPDRIKQQIQRETEELGLTVFSDQEYLEYIDRLNQTANRVFDFDKDYTENYFEDHYYFATERAKAEAEHRAYNG